MLTPYVIPAADLAEYEKLWDLELRRLATQDLEDEEAYLWREMEECEQLGAVVDGHLEAEDVLFGLVARRKRIAAELARRKRFAHSVRVERPSLVDFSHRLKAQLYLPEYLMSLGHEMERHGKYHLMCCAFHTEKTPSCFIYDSPTSHWKCFGCGDGGDVFDWLMKSKVLQWRDAVVEVADYLGVAMPQTPKVSSYWAGTEEWARIAQLRHTLGITDATDLPDKMPMAEALAFIAHLEAECGAIH